MMASNRSNQGRSTVKINESGEYQGISQMMIRRASTTSKKEQPSTSEHPYAASSDG